MKWIKKGLIIKAEGQRKWMQSHIQNPYAIELENNIIRVFFTTRGEKEQALYRATIGYVDLDKNNLNNVISISENPVMDWGKPGTFDEFGIMPGAFIRPYTNSKELWMYYVGWQRLVSVPYSWECGLAKSTDNGKNFQRIGDGPILGKSYNDPYLQNGCSSVIKKDNKYYMFYSSGIDWRKDIHTGKMESQYRLRRAVSDDGVSWKRDESYCIPLAFDDESQTSPSIYEQVGTGYHMFFPYRHSIEFRNAERGYRIGYAFSEDLLHWDRRDNEIGITLSEKGFDNEMICYPHVTKINEKVIMLYCGNGFGVGGLGYAELDDIDYL